MNLIFDIKNLRCSYDHPFVEGRSRVALEIHSLSIERGMHMFIVGESGIGKSTILETLGMMNNTIVAGEDTRFMFYDTDGNATDLYRLWTGGDKALSRFRLRNYSFIFQSTNLMRNFTAFENVAYTRLLQGHPRKECFEKTRKVLADIGLDHIDEKRMTQELSGGQQQRLAFARAVLPDYAVLFGDEPTGNLDAENAMRVMQMLDKQSDEYAGTTAIIVSHDMHLATTFADVIVKIRKMSRPSEEHSDEVTTYGYIDDNCIFRPDESRTRWRSSDVELDTPTFEEFLRKK